MIVLFWIALGFWLGGAVCSMLGSPPAGRDRFNLSKFSGSQGNVRRSQPSGGLGDRLAPAVSPLTASVGVTPSCRVGTEVPAPIFRASAARRFVAIQARACVPGAHVAPMPSRAYCEESAAKMNSDELRSRELTWVSARECPSDWWVVLDCGPQSMTAVTGTCVIPLVVSYDPGAQ